MKVRLLLFDFKFCPCWVFKRFFLTKNRFCCISFYIKITFDLTRLCEFAIIVVFPDSIRWNFLSCILIDKLNSRFWRISFMEWFVHPLFLNNFLAWLWYIRVAYLKFIVKAASIIHLFLVPIIGRRRIPRKIQF